MPSDPQVDALMRELLESGVAPKYILRLKSELEDHCLDLEDEALRFGVSVEAAADDARCRLGDPSTIAGAFARHPELRSWVYNASWLAPLLWAAAAICLPFAMLVRAIVQRDTLMRYAAASVGSATLTLGTLLAMDLAISSGWESYYSSSRLRAAADLRGRTHTPPATASPEKDSPIAASLAHASTDTSTNVRRFDRSRPEPVSPRRAVDLSAGIDARRLDADPIVTGRPKLDGMRALRLQPPSRVQFDVFDPPPPWTLPPTAVSSELRIRSAFSFGFGLSDQELRPIATVEPDYPWAAARRGLEGYVVVEYTVTTAGTVSEISVVESSNELFNRAALEAANGWKYRPRVIAGSAVDVRGVRTTIRFMFEA